MLQTKLIGILFIVHCANNWINDYHQFCDLQKSSTAAGWDMCTTEVWTEYDFATANTTGRTIQFYQNLNLVLNILDTNTQRELFTWYEMPSPKIACATDFMENFNFFSFLSLSPSFCSCFKLFSMFNFLPRLRWQNGKVRYCSLLAIVEWDSKLNANHIRGTIVVFNTIRRRSYCGWLNNFMPQQKCNINYKRLYKVFP